MGAYSGIKIFHAPIPLIINGRDSTSSYKLDGVGRVDNRPSTDKLHHFVQFFFAIKKKVPGEHSLKIKLSSSKGLGFMMLWISGGKKLLT